MATEEKIVYSVEVESGKAGKSLSDLKKEFKESSAELSKLTQGTKEYYDQLKKVASVKDEMGDLRDTIESFKPDQKLKALGNAVTVVASGFAAAQGAMSLFGTENKDLERTLVKVQAAMAFSQGLQGLQGLGDAFNLLKANVMQFTIFQKAATAAQWLWNAAMSANPIGLIVAGVLALVGAIKLLVSAQQDEAAQLERINKLNERALRLREQDIDLIKKRYAIQQETGSYELELAKALGKSSDELYAIEKRNIEKKISDLEVIKEIRGSLNSTELLELNKLNREKNLLDLKYASTKHDAFVKDREDETKKNKEELEKQHQDNMDAYNKRADAENALIEAREAKEKEAKANKLKTDWDELQASTDADLERENFKYSEKQRLREEDAQHERDVINGSFAIAKASNDGLQSLSDLYFMVKTRNLKKGSAEELKAAKQQFKINKALAITSATIQGVQAVLAAYSSGSAIPVVGAVTGPLFAALAAVTVAANIAKIARAKFDDGGAGGGGGASIPSPNAPNVAPPQQGSTQLNNDGTVKATNNKQSTIKAIVVETDVTKTQKRVGSIETNAKL